MRCAACNSEIDYEVKNTLTGHRHNNTGEYEDLCRNCLRISKQAAYSNFNNEGVDNDSTLGTTFGIEDTEAVYQGYSDTGWVSQD